MLSRCLTGRWVWGLAVLFLAATPATQASLTVYDLGTPVVTASQARVPVSAAFTPDHGDELVSFLINVAGSSPELTGSGTDYSRFSFALDVALAADWLPFGSPFAPPPVSFAQFDTFTAGLGAGPHLLGDLVLDLAGLPGDIPLNVMIAGTGILNATGAVSQVPGQPNTSALTDVAFSTDDQGATTFRTPGTGPGPGDVIPEPITAGSALLALAAVIGAARRRSEARR